jgi:hypothetical protein
MENNNVKMSTLRWLLGIFVTILLVAFGVIGAQLNAVDNKAESNKNGIHSVDGRLIRIEEKVDTINKNLEKVLE